LLDGKPAPPKKRGRAVIHFSIHVHCGQTAEWIRIPFGTEVVLGPGHIVFNGIQLPQGKNTPAPTFRPMSTVAKRSPISETAQLSLIQFSGRIAVLRSTYIVDAACCYRRISVVCRSVSQSLCLSVTIVSRANATETIKLVFGCGLGWAHACIRWGSSSPWELTLF